MRSPASRGALAVAFVALCALAACSHANYDPVVVATASPSPGTSAVPSASPSSSASSSPLVCNTPAPNAAFVAMGSYIEPHVDANYGTVYGYVLADSSGNYPLSAAVISVKVGTLVQFVNVDPVDASGTGTAHSAVGLQQNGFPQSVTFPSAARGSIGTTFSSSALWSTGRVAAGTSSLCYSQPFTTPTTGTYYFGDDQFYTSVNERDVIVVSP